MTTTTPPVIDVGMVVLHVKYNYRGVVVGVDRKCRQSEAWIVSNGVDLLKKGRNQPFYHVLADQRDRPGTPVSYVAHEHLVVDTPPEPITHPLIDDFFSAFDQPNGRHIPTDELAKKFPKATTASQEEEP